MQRCYKQTEDQLDLFLQHAKHAYPGTGIRTDAIAIYTVTRSLYGTVRSASEERSLLLDTEQFPIELTRMMVSFLKTN
jgi:hypothetical protein